MTRNEWADLGPEWGLCLISVGTVDPAYYPPKGPAKATRETEPRRLDPRAFASRVRVERARLAILDPIGERDAVAPLTRAEAVAILERALTENPPASVRTIGPGQTFDSRDLLSRLTADPNATSGRVPCPAHKGQDRNLAWRLAGDRVLLTCWSHGCSFESIVAAAR